MKRNCRYAKGPLMINALSRMLLLLLLSLLSSITMSPAAGITHNVALPLELPLLPLQQQTPHSPHTRSNYYDPNTEALAGLAAAAGYTQHYYGATSAAAAAASADDVDVGSDLAAVPYANYEPKAIVSANGFVPTGDNYHAEYSRLQSGLGLGLYGGELGDRGKIDFVINTANYEQNEELSPPSHLAAHLPPPSPHPLPSSSTLYYQSYGYQPQAAVPELAPPSTPLFDYPIEQFSNYRPRAVRGEAGQERRVAPQARHANEDSAIVYASSMQRSTLALPQQQQLQQQHEHQHQQHQQLLQPKQTQTQQLSLPPHQEDQQLAERQLVDLPTHSETRSGLVHHAHNTLLPPITTSVHHTPESHKALAGVPLSKHIEVTKHVPVTHYQQQHVPYKHPVQLRVPRPVITTIPKPIPIRVPVSKTITVPRLQEVKIPVEQVKPVAVERPVPFVVERRVPYRVEKPVATPIYYPYPVKVPIVRTVVHKQRPGKGHWAPLNHLLG